MTETGWKIYRLSDIFTLIGGGTPRTTNPDYWNGNIPWLSVADFNHGYRYVYTSEKTITLKAIEESSTTLLKKGQLIISARGTVGVIAQLGRDMAFNQSCYGITAKDYLTTNDFLYYLLNYEVRQLKQITHGGVFDTITRDTFDQISLDLPPLPIQHTIARILGSLDDKIELNRQMNETLEAMARAIFKSWFVDFDPVRAKAEGRQPTGMDAETAALFPNSFEVVDGREVPKGWKIKAIREETSNIQYGLTRSASQEEIGPKFLRITDIQGGKINWDHVPYCVVSPDEFEKYRINIGDIFVARTGASTGENTYIIDAPNSVFASYLVRFKFKVPAMARAIGEFMRTQSYFDFIDTAIGGSAQPNASAQVLASALFAFPTPEIAKAYAKKVLSLDNMRATNEKQSRTLAQIRDSFLPKLMSGEISIGVKS